MSGVLRYAPRHVTDLLLTRSLPIIGVSFVLLIPLMVSGPGAARDTQQLTGQFADLLNGMGPFFTIIALYGLIGEDVRQGYYRFIFAKPVSPVAYYAASCGAAALAFVVGVLGCVGLFALTIQPVWPAAGILDVMVNFALLGSVILVFSRLTRFDWLIAFIVLGLSDLARERWPADGSALGTVLNLVLPPTNTPRLFTDGLIRWDPLLHVLVYAGAMFAVTMLIVRKVPMGSAR